MDRRLRALASERLRLMSIASVERARLSAAFAPVDAAGAVLARVKRGLRWAAENPYVSMGVVAAIAAFKPRPILSWLLRGLSAWRAYEEVRRRVAAPRLSSFQR
jgi:hypothetical protein